MSIDHTLPQKKKVEKVDRSHNQDGGRQTLEDSYLEILIF